MSHVPVAWFCCLQGHTHTHTQLLQKLYACYTYRTVLCYTNEGLLVHRHTYMHTNTHIRACQEILMKTKWLIKHDREERWAAVLCDVMGSAWTYRKRSLGQHTMDGWMDGRALNFDIKELWRHQADDTCMQVKAPQSCPCKDLTDERLQGLSCCSIFPSSPASLNTVAGK